MSLMLMLVTIFGGLVIVVEMLIDRWAKKTANRIYKEYQNKKLEKIMQVLQKDEA